MTTFIFIRSENIGAIDNASAAIDCSSLPANVEKVIWDSHTGWLEYNDQPKIHAPFADPSTYQAQLNALMTALSTTTPPLSLAQAQLVKQALVDALYGMKRLKPITVSTSQGSLQWDAADEAVATMNQQLATSAAGFTVSTAGMATQINNMITPLNADQATAKGNFASPIHDSGLGYYLWDSKPDVPTGAPYSTVTGSNSSPSGGPFPWAPYGASSTVNLSLADLTAIVNAVGTRRQSLAGTRASKKNAIAVLGSVASVIAYDVTTGWAY
jgi:hypothetical protein